MLLTFWGDELDVVCEEQVIACQFICQVIDKYQEEKGSKHKAVGTLLFTAPTLEWWSPNFTLKVLLFRNCFTQRFILGWIPIASIFLISRR